jgi:type II secretory pathway pseudopilin PulG
LVLSLTGVLLAAFVPTFLKQVHTSKLAEATERLASLHRHAALYYEHDQLVGAGLRRGCLPASAGPYPLAPSVEPISVDFQADPLGKQTWGALGQTEPAWLRYSYEVSTPDPGCGLQKTRATITFRAHGDLDGDGTESLLERTSVAGDGAAQHTLVPGGPLRVLGRVE